MVRLIVKRGDEPQFLLDTQTTTPTLELGQDLLSIYNARLKVQRICSEIEEMSIAGIALPPSMVGLTSEQIEELKLVDEWTSISIPSGGSDADLEEDKDPLGRRNGQRPKSHLAQMLKKTVAEVKEALSKKLVDQGVPLTMNIVQEQMDLLKAAVDIVYPMGLPPHDPIRMEFEGKEELDGTQDSLMIISEEEAELWFCGKQITPGKKLGDFIGFNEKSKIVVKLSKKGSGPPGREPVLGEEERKQLMLMAYKKQQEAKRLEDDEDESHLNSEWADGSVLKRSFHGIRDVSWKPK